MKTTRSIITKSYSFTYNVHTIRRTSGRGGQAAELTPHVSHGSASEFQLWLQIQLPAHTRCEAAGDSSEVLEYLVPTQET